MHVGAVTIEITEEVSGAVRERRESLRLSQNDAAARAGLSAGIWNMLENGRRESIRARTAKQIAEALGWTPDSIERLARGEEPVEAAPERPAVYASTADGQVFTAAQIALIEATVHATLERIKGEQ